MIGLLTGVWPLWLSIGVLVAAAGVLWVAGTRLAHTADELSDRTGLGEAIGGALFLGGVTSLSGIITTVTGALAGDAGFALANPVGGVAIQTVWLAIADLIYRRANLEHAAASLQNLMQSLILVALLSLPVIAYATPQFVWGWVHPVTIFIPVLYGYSLFLLRRMQATPMWKPQKTDDTVPDQPEEPSSTSLRALWAMFAGLAVVVGITGWAIGRAGLGLVEATGWPSDVTGFTITTAISSLPELVTLIAAVRMGALTLGLGNIIGGNVFDTLLISISDVAYTEGTIYQAAGTSSLVLLAATAFMASVLAVGLLARERKGIGFEGFAIPGIYVATVVLAITA
ncbi:hypothetical protein M4I32_14035 [Microbacterium sp. LRZ72]|uniref:sodium:calcium antiporter n=1 Tax=Microbacterium sp. LRZ72 TaxID=2942481 RepID=UPI0029B66994|nr:hypothetical protein [Microbacterium sp. LRZ72]MDX2377914.1 hypothetical protein [Microbacterium sp. LRZ72]